MGHDEGRRGEERAVEGLRARGESTELKGVVPLVLLVQKERTGRGRTKKGVIGRLLEGVKRVVVVVGKERVIERYMYWNAGLW